VAVVEQHVLRLDAAMDDAAAMRVVERVCHLAHDTRRVGRREAVVPP
jgi:hypothetical protein